MSEKNSKVEIEIFRKKDIGEMINDSRLWEQEFLATTKQRLNMHAQNSSMHEDDVVLLIAWYEGVMIGYIGGFVDFLLTNDGYQKITWLHTWWMDPNYRFTKAGLMLFNNMYDLCKGRIGVSQFTPSAGRIYYKSEKFQALTQMKGSKFLVKLSFIDFFKGKKYFVPLKPFLWLIDLTINSVGGVFRKISLLNVQLPKMELLSSMDNETSDFINKIQSEQICRREKDFFNSLIKNKIILQTYGPSVNDNRYFFSHRAKQFDFFYIKTKNEKGDVDSFIVLQVRDGVLKVLYSYYLQSAEKKSANIISKYVDQLNCHTILIYDDKLSRELRKMRMQYIIERKKEKEIIVSKEFSRALQWETNPFNYGDGDCCFA